MHAPLAPPPRIASLRAAHAACALLALLCLLVAPRPAAADPGDIDAAARGVVRVVLIARDGEELVPVTHGSGFAVTPSMIVTNAHVIREALQDDGLRIGIVPSEGDDGAYARPVAVSPRNDLALVEIVDGSLRLPPLTFSGEVPRGMGEVSAVGYPMNVDLAQGLDLGDIFRAQPPVKSRGFLSGERPSRQFDTILHTAPIARGNSGGPLLDGCGRVLGVNSFGADSDGSDAEFYFAVSLRELLPFLRANEIDPRINALPCRSIDELNAAERARFEAQRAEARAKLQAREQQLREAREKARIAALLAVSEERENAMAIAALLLLLGGGAGFMAAQLRRRALVGETSQTPALAAAGIAGAALIGAVLVWITRPGFAEVEDRAAAAMEEAPGGQEPGSGDGPPASLARDGTLICSLVPDRSRVVTARTDDVQFDWVGDGCVNSRTQYGMMDGEWTRVFVPDDEEAVSVNIYDPDTRTFRTDRYLLGREAMEEARRVRDAYDPPACGLTDAARIVAEQQSAVMALLPERPNERLVYSCEAKLSGSGQTGQ
ncbi:trypsin-like peptidase domain-containing protein [Erythrobacter sp.]|uniref:S1 family peptidase n=1 Tax=Erythrobacter sp. TaxID=1042 RepID=UPI001425EDF8|nr:trypsin-like peptidase domain-containing protein [Erythrobacter sp.]QIQ85618.1 MAG: trypsin-like serine protease [Erythrobacter sp.]